MSYNSIVISSGHGKYIRGAADILDEVDEARKVVNSVAEVLRRQGVAVEVFHDNTSHDQNTNLNTIVNYHNAQERQLDVSVHFNAYEHTSKPMGTECLYVSQSGLAAEMAAAISDAGAFIDRGPKKRTDLFFLNKTEQPSILLEVCFVDSSTDADLYHQHFNSICDAIAAVISGEDVEAPPPTLPEPPEPELPNEVLRPTLSKGSVGEQVEVVQRCLMHKRDVDGDFGSKTDEAVRKYQAKKHLTVDGVVGYPQTWPALEEDFRLPPYRPPSWALTEVEQEAIADIAGNSQAALFNWPGRGTAPIGYVEGFALAWAVVIKKLNGDDSSAMEMAKADTYNDDLDALSWYRSNMTSLGWVCSSSGIDTLRYLFALLMGLGMRESSGKYCEGRDQSATNTTSDTAEAGLYQMSWNARSCSPEMQKLFDLYATGEQQTFLDFFEQEVSCSSSSWASYGSGAGLEYQEMAKRMPPFAVETTAIGLRNLRQHWGPINRKEVTLSTAAESMLRAVQEYIEAQAPRVA